ncbi:uncharacterized protein LOC127245247 isoform X2 [Andrographis paniculata]|uniref:uncharacterized protein LOC127245247 isoform X2 n=1 Tax=Andrographis paniculata TaxID=175694 RepID=UPI0021E73032|nr:uncharacterized protein LOC127245247 isoform X2 [Andrographis paniculata]
MDSRLPIVVLPLVLAFIIVVHPLQKHVAFGELILEDGYTVSTVVVGDKSSLKVKPHSILPQSPPSDLFVLLDSVDSSFYTVSAPAASTEIHIERLAGNGKPGYADGDLGSATFNKPKSFAIDFGGNVYVADQANHAIRKITKSGVTTIAGGYSQKLGREDGPAQNASFSNEFLLSFFPERCALMIADHGNRLVRQINLKPADCTLHSGGGSVLGTNSVWILALGISCIFGAIVGFVIRPYIIPFEGTVPRHRPSSTWTHSLTTLERQITMFCSAIKSAAVRTPVYSLLRQVILLIFSLLSLMFSPSKVKPSPPYEKPVSLLDSDAIIPNSSNSNGNSMVVSPKIDYQLKDLLDFNGGQMMVPVNSNQALEQEQVKENSERSNIDSIILANLVNFDEQASFNSPEPSEHSSGTVKRRSSTTTMRYTSAAFSVYICVLRTLLGHVRTCPTLH